MEYRYNLKDKIYANKNIWDESQNYFYIDICILKKKVLIKKFAKIFLISFLLQCISYYEIKLTFKRLTILV